jgi:hypothetical protein
MRDCEIDEKTIAYLNDVLRQMQARASSLLCGQLV